MKIELEIDDKYEDTNLCLFWGMVPVARWRVNNKYWEIKTEFCSNCGNCCDSEKVNVPFPDGKGSCIYLEDSPGNGKMCGLKNFRPIACSIADQPIEGCTVKWEKVT